MTDLVQAPLTSAIVKLHKSRDPVLSKVLGLIHNGWKVNREIDLQPYFSRKDQLSMHRNAMLAVGFSCHYTNRVTTKTAGTTSPVSPGNHSHETFGQKFLWWPKMDSEIELTVKNCKTCEIHKKMPVAAPIHSWEYPS